jgi:hypothetical protein
VGWFCNIEKELKNKQLLVTMTTLLNMQQYSNFSVCFNRPERHTRTTTRKIFSTALKNTDSKKIYLHRNKEEEFTLVFIKLQLQIES